jgi:hypothetical protein
LRNDVILSKKNELVGEEIYFPSVVFIVNGFPFSDETIGFSKNSLFFEAHFLDEVTAKVELIEVDSIATRA